MDFIVSFLFYLFTVIFLCDYFTVRPFMIRACHNGMCDGDFVFIYIWPTQGENPEWDVDDKYDDIAKVAYRHLIRVIITNGGVA